MDIYDENVEDHSIDDRATRIKTKSFTVEECLKKPLLSTLTRWTTATIPFEMFPRNTLPICSCHYCAFVSGQQRGAFQYGSTRRRTSGTVGRQSCSPRVRAFFCCEADPDSRRRVRAPSIHCDTSVADVERCRKRRVQELCFESYSRRLYIPEGRDASVRHCGTVDESHREFNIRNCYEGHLMRSVSQKRAEKCSEP